MIFLVVAVGISVFAFDAYYLTYIHPRAPPTLAPFEFRNFTLAEKIPVSHDTILLRFNADLPQVDLPEGIPLPSHVVVKDDSCQIARSYTPITYGRKHFDLLVKKYDNGSLSSFLHKIEIGDAVPMRGPISTVPYVPNAVDEIGLIAGGTGITPLYQLIKRVLKDPVDKTRLKLVYANRSPADILLRAELDLLSAAHPDRLKVVYVVDTVRNQKQWQGQVGSVTRKILQQNLPDPKQGLKAGVLVCGPDGFINHVAGAKPSEDEQGPLNGLLKELGFQDRQVYKL
ncbi:NADH-cytochrome b5 reductase-like protein [Phlyctochytrium arcticum]|nr:NADH-cytochrome b5 reductase-like protein [Phlyctochytrium arcticum]